MVKVKESKLKILAAGDLHGSSDIAQKLADRATKEKVDLVLLLGDIHGGMKESRGLIAPFKKAGKKVLFVPGNWDSSEEAKSLVDMYGVRNIDGYYAVYDDVGIVGMGNPNFQLDIDEEKEFDKLKLNFDNMKADKRILISHLHAEGSKAEFSGIPGSSALRKAVRYFQPDFLLQAHIHEAEGIEEKIGKTRVISVGRKGKIIEL